MYSGQKSVDFSFNEDYFDSYLTDAFQKTEEVRFILPPSYPSYEWLYGSVDEASLAGTVLGDYVLEFPEEPLFPLESEEYKIPSLIEWENTTSFIQSDTPYSFDDGMMLPRFDLQQTQSTLEKIIASESSFEEEFLFVQPDSNVDVSRFYLGGESLDWSSFKLGAEMWMSVDMEQFGFESVFDTRNLGDKTNINSIFYIQKQFGKEQPCNLKLGYVPQSGGVDDPLGAKENTTMTFDCGF